MPLTNFKAFGDYKPPVYIYLAALSIKTFGLNEFAIRFPSAMFGVISVICTYLIVGYLVKLFDSGTSHKNIAQLLSSFFLTISPWSINLSRVAFEANVASGLFLLSLVIFLKYINTDKSKLSHASHLLHIFLIPLFFVLPLYTFNSSRIFIPIILLFLLIFFYKKIFSNIKSFIFSLIIFTLLFAPLIPHLMSKEGKLRFNEVNIFTNPAPVELANSRIEKDGGVWWSKIINNRRVYYFEDYIKHFFDNFKGDFLFLRGDINSTFSTRRNGQLYLLDLILIVSGIYFLWFNNRKFCIFLLLWLFSGTAPAGLARETPHALRIMNLLPTYQIFAALGLLFILRKINKNIFKITIPIIIIVLLSAYLFIYYRFYPKEQSKYFQYGYKELVNFIYENQNQYNNIYMSSIRGRPYIYFLLYGQISESDYLSESSVSEDNFGFYNVSRLKNIYFAGGAIRGDAGSLTVAAPEEFGSETNLNIIKKIKFLDRTDNFWIVKN